MTVDVPARMRELRTRAGLTLKEVGDTLGVPPITVSRWERGQRGYPRDRMDEWARALGYTAEVIVRRRGAPDLDLTAEQGLLLDEFLDTLPNMTPAQVSATSAMLDTWRQPGRALAYTPPRSSITPEASRHAVAAILGKTPAE